MTRCEEPILIQGTDFYSNCTCLFSVIRSSIANAIYTKMLDAHQISTGFVVFVFLCNVRRFCSLKTLLELSNVHKRNRNWFWSCSHSENGLLRKSSRPQPVKRWFFQLLIIGRKKKSIRQHDTKWIFRLRDFENKALVITVQFRHFFLGFPVFSTTMEHSFSVTITFKWLHHSVSWQTNVKVKRKNISYEKLLKSL